MLEPDSPEYRDTALGMGACENCPYFQSKEQADLLGLAYTGCTITDGVPPCFLGEAEANAKVG